MDRKTAEEILELKPPYNAKALSRAFRLFAKKFHPDRGGDHEYFLRGKEAQELLESFGDVSAIYAIEVDEISVVLGIPYTIELNHQATCPYCRGNHHDPSCASCRGTGRLRDSMQSSLSETCLCERVDVCDACGGLGAVDVVGSKKVVITPQLISFGVLNLPSIPMGAEFFTASVKVVPFAGAQVLHGMVWSYLSVDEVSRVKDYPITKNIMTKQGEAKGMLRVEGGILLFRFQGKDYKFYPRF